MAITASMIKELRERTGVGMMDCKKALTEAGGDIDAAVEALRKAGAAAAEKKAGRIAAEGVITMAANDTAAVLVEINCETDFAAKDESFTEFAQMVAQRVLADQPADVDALNILSYGDSGNTVEQARQELITKIGENLSVRRFIFVPSEDGHVSTYLHGSRIGVAVRLSGGEPALGRDIAMHIAASRPLCVSEADMDPALVEKEKDIFIAQARESGKPDNIVEKMVVGRVKKFLKENTLLGQPFVKNPDQTIEQLLASNSASLQVMQRLEVGEGIEKRVDDFAAEVRAQAGS